MNTSIDTNKVLSGKVHTLNEKLKEINYVLLGIVLILLVTVVAIMVGVSQIATDSFRYNSLVYREYAQKLEASMILERENLELKKELRSNQEILIEQQHLILKKMPKN